MIWLPVVGTYADIDVYASIIAYADLLNQRGKTAKTYIPVTPNYSVPDELRLPEWENAIFNLQPNDEAIILDISNPEAIAKFVPDHQILEIIDHPPGYEKYWQTRIGDKAVIEKIGAVATSIFEWWGECWDYDKMSPEIAKLLLGAILDNTLNFNADITTERDHQAASKLAKIAKTTLEDFTNWYFSAVSQTILSDLRNALIKDCKQVTMPAGQETFTFAQLTIWDSAKIINQINEITQIMDNNGQNWLVSIICISEKRNYILVSSPKIATYFTKLLNLRSQKGWLISDQLYLRKEIIAKMLQ